MIDHPGDDPSLTPLVLVHARAADAPRVTDLEHVSADLERLLDALDLPRLGTLASPVGIIAGEVDPSGTPAGMIGIRVAILGAKFTVVPGGPHMLNLGRPADWRPCVPQQPTPMEES